MDGCRVGCWAATAGRRMGRCLPSDRLPHLPASTSTRMQAELEVLRAPSAPAAAASLGYSAADLEAEVTSLRRRRASHLEQAAAAAEAAAATAAGADVVEEQAAQLHASMVQRLQAKQQVGGGAGWLVWEGVCI